MIDHINYNLTYSLRVFLEEHMEEFTDTKVFYDGIRIGDIEKPFGMVRYLHSNKLSVATGRRDYQDTFRYEISIYGRSVDEMVLLEGKITNIFRDNKVLYYVFDETTKTFSESGIELTADVNTYTPLPSGELSNETEHHYGLLDISFDILIDTSKETLNQ